MIKQRDALGKALARAEFKLRSPEELDEEPSETADAAKKALATVLDEVGEYNADLDAIQWFDRDGEYVYLEILAFPTDPDRLSHRAHRARLRSD